jgi:hypothetical protein
MEGIKDFETFYAVEIAPNLAEFKQAGNIVRQWKIAAIVSGVIFIPSVFASIVWGSNLFFIWALALAVLAVSVYNFYRKENSLVDDYKLKIVKAIIGHLNVGLEYQPALIIPQREYKQSGLYRRIYDYYNGDDLIKGIYKGISFHCSELHTQYDSGMPYNRVTTIFKGLFFAAAVNASYNSGTYVWLKDYEQLAVSIADDEYRMLAFPEATKHIITGNQLFDSVYSVYTTNPAHAAVILDEEMVNNLLSFRKQIQRNVLLSVVMGKCYVAIPIKEGLFEVPDDLYDKEEIKKCFFAVLLILSIINQLNLKKLL